MRDTEWRSLSIEQRKEHLENKDIIGLEYIDIVRAPRGWGVFASIGHNFQHAIFGRDSIETAMTLCEHDQDLAREVIIMLAKLQGTDTNILTEEEPGKIHHEYRSSVLAGVKAPVESINIMHQLQKAWGTPQGEEVIYYGTFDATPLYVVLVQMYTALYGQDILDKSYNDRSGKQSTIKQSVLAAVDWVTSKINQRQDHLFMYRRLNPHGWENQTWKDSPTSYLFDNGEAPNFDAGIVSIELQGYAYDALFFGASLSEEKKSKELIKLAKDLQASTIKKLWLKDLKCFAQGLGTDQKGLERPINTLTSNAGLLLDSGLLEDPSGVYKEYVDSVVSIMVGPEFITDAGLRCRANRHGRIPGFADYHGSYAVWPKETINIARGMERFGYKKEATILYKNILSSIKKSGEFYEFFYVDVDGPDSKVWYSGRQAVGHFQSRAGDESLPIPEPGQAWSIAAAIASSIKLSQNS